MTILNCTNCDVEIQQVTFNANDGLCAVCRRGSFHCERCGRRVMESDWRKGDKRCIKCTITAANKRDKFEIDRLDFTAVSYSRPVDCEKSSIMSTQDARDILNTCLVIIRPRPETRQVFIAQTTTHGVANFAADYLHELGLCVSSETIEDYCERNTVSTSTCATYGSTHQMVMLDPIELDHILHSDLRSGLDSRFERFEQLFPLSNGYVELSNPGFSKDLDQALVCLGLCVTGEAGHGRFLFFRREDGRLRLQKQAIAWTV